MKLNHLNYDEYIKSISEELIGRVLYSTILLNTKTLLFPLAEEPNKILVISGHSRGATTANYIAKQYQGNTNYDKIFAYTFGSPDYYFGNNSIDMSD